MGLALIRIDDRLIHGQVVESWIPHLGINETVVACDEAASDEISRTLMRLSLPESVNLRVLKVAEAARYLAGRLNGEKRILVLVPGPAEILTLLQAGVRLTTVNVGGMHYSAGKMQIGKAIFLSDADSKNLKDIAARGVQIEGRGVPSDKAMNLSQMLGD
ncbi:MAG: PTS sugar transporter subunit IIB [bacterium]